MRLLLLLTLLPSATMAYAGLGPILPLIGNGLVLLAIFLMTFLGLFLYPLKQFLAKAKSKKKSKSKHKDKK